MGFVNRNAQNQVKDFVVEVFGDTANINNPREGDSAFVLDTCDTYVYKDSTWNLYISAAAGGTDDQVASEVPVTPSGNLTSTDVQAALVELQGDIDGIADTDDQTAAEVSYDNATSGLTAVDAQAAIDELKTLVVDAEELQHWEEQGTSFVPKVSGYNLGDADNRIAAIYMASDLIIDNPTGNLDIELTNNSDTVSVTVGHFAKAPSGTPFVEEKFASTVTKNVKDLTEVHGQSMVIDEVGAHAVRMTKDVDDLATAFDFEKTTYGDGLRVHSVFADRTDDSLIPHVVDAEEVSWDFGADRTVARVTSTTLKKAALPVGFPVLVPAPTEGVVLRAESNDVLTSYTVEAERFYTDAIEAGELNGHTVPAVGSGTLALTDDITDVCSDTCWDAAGDIIVGTGADAAARLAIGTAGQVLTVSGGTAVWATPAGGADGNGIYDGSDDLGADTTVGTLGHKLTLSSTGGTVLQIDNGGGNVSGLALNSTSTTNTNLTFQKAGAVQWFMLSNNLAGTNDFSIRRGPSGAITDLGVSKSTGAVSVGTAVTGSKFGVSGNMVVGTSFAGAAAPSNGAFIEGKVAIGTTVIPNDTYFAVQDDINATSITGLFENASTGTSATSRVNIQNGQGSKASIIMYNDNHIDAAGRAGYLEIGSAGGTILSLNAGDDMQWRGLSGATIRAKFTEAGNFGVGAYTTASAPGAFVDIDGSTTQASLRLRTTGGGDPSTLNDGDVWFDGTDMKARVGGVTKTFTLV